MDQIERIKHMEAIMDKAANVLEDLRNAVEAYKNMYSEIDELEEYYGSELWSEDYDADSEGKLPDDLKRGILSEDGLWDLLLERDELLYQIQNLDITSDDSDYEEDNDECEDDCDSGCNCEEQDCECHCCDCE